MHRMFTWLTAVLLTVPAGAALAQAQTGSLPLVTIPPNNVMVPNYSSVPVGEIGSLEGGAYLARVDDASASWFNPAGLTRARQASVGGSAGVFVFGSLAPAAGANSGGSFQNLPAMGGVIVPKLFGKDQWAGGFAITTVYAWNQGTDVALGYPAGSSNGTVAYSSDASFTGWMANAALGYAPGGRLRVGTSLAVQATYWDTSQTRSEQVPTNAGLNALQVSSKASAYVVHARLSLGAQYDLSPTVRLGALLRTPGLRLMRSGSYRQEGLSRIGVTTTTATFAEPNGQVEYKLPLEFRLGGAYIGKRAQVEADIATFAGTGAYASFQTSQMMTIITDPGLGAPPTAEQRALAPAIVDSLTVVNVAIGGEFALNASGSWKVHGGYQTDRSPVGSNDTQFTKVDMQAWTVGVSGRTSFFLGSVGLRYESGSSDPFVFRALQGGQTVQTTFRISNLGLVYSVSFKF